MSPSQDPSRRGFLGGLAQVAGVSALGACSTREPPVEASPVQASDGLDRDLFHVHNEGPLALETRRSSHGRGVLTPNDRFFVRNNLPRPVADILDDRDAWSVVFTGVLRPGPLTLGLLKTLGTATEAVTLQCSGNGRAFFEHGPSGSPWGVGAAGCALWTGVRLKDVWAYLGGVESEARFLTATGGEPLPEGVDPASVVVERSVPIAKAQGDCLLAWEMNGAPLPLAHGGPLRLIVPGYFGCNQIKYVRHVAAARAQSTAKIQSKGYRFRPVGTGGAPEQPSMWRMPVKSWLNGPGTDGHTVAAGSVVFYGVALSGERGIARVEASLDGGQTWQPASLDGPDLGPNAWRTFSFTHALPEGRYTIHTRATDRAGELQPRDRVENERGYGHNGWLDHGLDVVVTTGVQPLPEQPDTRSTSPQLDQGPVALGEADLRGKELFTADAQPACGACHTLSDAGTQGVTGPDLDVLAPDPTRVASAVTNGVGAMPAYRGRLTELQIKELAAYVAKVTGG